MVARDIILAELTGGHVHLCHMSTRGSVELIRRAKEKGLRVTAEATPASLHPDPRALRGIQHQREDEPAAAGSRRIGTPSARDSGTGPSTCICTDHAPHHYDAKEREFDDAPNGIIGLETALGLAIRELVETGLLTLPDLIARMSTVPARIFSLPGGTLAVGAPADVVIFDPARRWVVRREDLHSKSTNTPFLNETLMGQADMTLVGGRVAFDRSGRPVS